MDNNAGGVDHLLERVAAQFTQLREHFLRQVGQLESHPCEGLGILHNSFSLSGEHLANALEHKLSRLSVNGLLNCLLLQESVHCRELSQNFLDE